MKFVAKELAETDDASRGTITKREIVKNSILVVAVFYGVYLALGWTAELIAISLPVSFEKRLGFLGGAIVRGGLDSGDRVEQAREILDELLANADLPELDFNVVIIPQGGPNAIASPGGTIALTEELFDIVDSRESLAMVLGHELGHFVQRDHMRGMGRGLIFAAALGVIFGGSEIKGAATKLIDFGEKSHSRAQEEGADSIGLELLVTTYGHAGGATDFFKRLDEEHGYSKLAQYLVTHPAPLERVQRLRKIIEAEGYEIRAPERLVVETEPIRNAAEVESEEDFVLDSDTSEEQ